MQLPSNKNAHSYFYSYLWPPCQRAFIFIVCGKSEIRPISDANERERQTQQRWIQYVTGNPDPRTFTTETSLRARTATSNSAREQRRKRQGQETTEQREHRSAQQTAIL